MKPDRTSPRLLLLDIGNTHCHVGLSTGDQLLRHADLPTPALATSRGGRLLKSFLGREAPGAAVLCSVVPGATRHAQRLIRTGFDLDPLLLTHATVRGVGLDYPTPETIGPDRLANAIAARHYFGQPCVVVDFGTAVTFDIVNARGDYVGGIIAPGLAAMTEYLHEKTALLPRIQIREVTSAIGRSTEEAMLVGAVHGYRGLVRELIVELRKELAVRRLPVVATGGYAQLMAHGVSDIHHVQPNLTLDGLRLLWLHHQDPPPSSATSRRRRSKPTPR
ncbi:MAG: type III pantothenate kinase [Verrucomicrobiales bacterium]|nr:type III pantothenate kinase [Verrucomicrobiales bacterium]